MVTDSKKNESPSLSIIRHSFRCKIFSYNAIYHSFQGIKQDDTIQFNKGNYPDSSIYKHYQPRTTIQSSLTKPKKQSSSLQKRYKKRYVTPTYPFIFSPLKTAINAHYILNNNSNIVFVFYIFTTNNPILPRHQRESYPQHAYH